MDAWLDFARGPLFRLSFAVMVLGVLRVLILSLLGIVRAWRRTQDPTLPWRDIWLKPLSWLFPVSRLHRARPLYSAVSVLFHIGLILVPLFYSAHVILWTGSTGFGWGFWLPQELAHWLTGITVVAALLLAAMRAGSADARGVSGAADYLWPLLLAVPFATGFVTANLALAPGTWEWLMLLHLLSADLVMLLVPFTRIAHVVLLPLGPAVGAVAWKFPRGAGDRVMATLGREHMREEVQP